MTPQWADWVARARAVPIEDEIARRGIKLARKGPELVGPCPKCGGDDRFAVNVAKAIFNCRGCHAKGDVIALAEFLDGVDFAGAVETLTGEPPPKPNGKDRTAKTKRDIPAGAKEVVAESYVYEDTNGDIAFVVDRIEYQTSSGALVEKDGKRVKNFKQKRPDPNRPDEWIFDTEGAPVVPYRVTELIEAVAVERAIWIVEGERKVDLLRGWNISATCCRGGAGKWRPEHSEFLRGAVDCVIVPDNDEPGRRHADVVANSLRAVGVARVRVLNLPGLPPKGDVVDWAAAGGTAERLIELVEQAPDWLPATGNGKAQAPPSTTPPPAKMPILTLDEWLSRDLPKPDFLLGELLSTTSRAIINAPTGIGKTMFVIGMFMGMSAGLDFLRWRSVRPVRTLFIDGEMSRRLLKERLAAEVNRLGVCPQNMHVLSREDVETLAPLNTRAGQMMIERVIEHLGGIDIIGFDNVMSLIGGDMKDEETWRQTLPWVLSLTRRNIGQVWVHHTGHDQTRGYGTSTREWQMSTVGHLEKIERPDSDVSFLLKFPKARERTPDNRADFADLRVALLNDHWTWQAADNVRKTSVAPLASKFYGALVNATIGNDANKMFNCPAATIEHWRAECIKVGLLDKDKGDSARSLFSKHKRDLIAANWIACNETMAWTMPN